MVSKHERRGEWERSKQGSKQKEALEGHRNRCYMVVFLFYLGTPGTSNGGVEHPLYTMLEMTALSGRIRVCTLYTHRESPTAERVPLDYPSVSSGACQCIPRAG